MNPNERVLGGLHGLVVGDAPGVPVQFVPREAVRADPVRGTDRSFRRGAVTSIGALRG